MKNLPQLVHKKLIEAKECKRGKISGVCITADGIAVLTACGVDTTAVKLEPQVKQERAVASDDDAVMTDAAPVVKKEAEQPLVQQKMAFGGREVDAFVLD